MPGGCGEYEFYIGIWNRDDAATVTRLPLNTVSRFPITDVLPSSLKVKRVNLVTGGALSASNPVSYTITANGVTTSLISYSQAGNTIVIKLENADISMIAPGFGIPPFRKGTEYYSFFGAVVTAELCQ